MTDVILNLLDLMRVRSTAYIAKNLTAPWGVHVDEHATLSRFHLVVSGSTWIGMPDKSEVHKLNAGDIAIIPQGKAHDYYHDQAHQLRDVKAYPTAQSSPRFEIFDKEGDDTHLLCGYFEMSPNTPGLIISLLPDIIIGKGNEAGLAKKFSMIVDLARQEISNPATLSQSTLNRLTEVLCVQTIGAWLELALPDNLRLQELSNPKTRLVLDAIHNDPSAPWTLDALAKLYGQSRTAFASDFKRTIGVSPMKYVCQWRIKNARQMLENGTYSLDEIAFKSGYSDTNAFNRAFKREIGSAPGAFNRAVQAAK